MNARVMRGGGRKLSFEKQKLEKGVVKKVLKRLWKYLKRHPFYLSIVCFSILLASAFNLTLPIILKIVIDDYIKAETINLQAILLIVGGLIISSIGVSITDYFQQFLMAKIASLASKEIREDAFSKLLKLPISYFDKNSYGVIMSNLTNDVETVSNALSNVVPQFIKATITIIGAFILMLITSWQLSIVSFAVIPIMIFGTLFITKKATKHFQTQQIKLGTINGIVKENITGLKVVKLYNQEDNMKEKFAIANDQLRKASFQGQMFSGLMMPLIRLIDNLLYGLLISIGAYLHINYGIVSVGKIQAMTNYAKLSTRPINDIAQTLNIIQIAIVGGDRIFKIIDEIDEYENEQDDKITSIKGNIEFDHVFFGYDLETTVLHDINFKVPAGQTIAIVGPTGGGKTTIINLLMRFYDPSRGVIRLDGMDINNLSKDYLRSKIGIVLQSTYLFRGTILENIRYGRSHATYEEVVEACKLAQVHDIIDRLPKKYETRVKEGGSNFSHGERQLLSIARTILSNPSILILDEATSLVDTRTETKIQTSMAMLVKDRTSFIIAHRLQTIKNANTILVIKDGSIIESGNHDELLAQEGYYYSMYSAQFGTKNH